MANPEVHEEGPGDQVSWTEFAGSLATGVIGTFSASGNGEYPSLQQGLRDVRNASPAQSETPKSDE